MKVKFLKTNNSMFECMIGKEVNINIDLCVNYTFNPSGMPFDFRHGTAKTSRIDTIKYIEVSMNCYDIIVNTVNSEYVFQYGEPSDKKPLSQQEKIITALSMGLL